MKTWPRVMSSAWVDGGRVLGCGRIVFEATEIRRWTARERGAKQSARRADGMRILKDMAEY